MTERVSRRQWLRTSLAAAGIGSLGGCIGDGSESQSDDPAAQSDAGGEVSPQANESGATEGEEAGESSGDGGSDGELDAGGDWPQAGYVAGFRGATDSHRGPTTALADHWSAVVTETTRPVVAEGTAYVTDEAGSYHAVDVRTGDTEWIHETEYDAVPDGPAPAVSDGTLYGATEKRVHAIDTETGELDWTWEEMSAIPSHLVVDEERVYVGGDHLRALDRSTGAVRWDDHVEERALLGYDHLAAADGSVYLAASPGEDHPAVVLSYDATSGELQWRREIDAIPSDSDATVGRIAVDGDRVYVPGQLTEQFRALDATTGETAWSLDTPGLGGDAVAVWDGTVFTGTVAPDAPVRAVDAQTGEEVSDWNPQATFGVAGYPVVTDGILYALGSPSPSAPETLYVMDARTGELSTKYGMAPSISGLAVLEDVVLVTESDDTLRALVPESTV